MKKSQKKQKPLIVDSVCETSEVVEDLSDEIADLREDWGNELTAIHADLRNIEILVQAIDQRLGRLEAARIVYVAPPQYTPPTIEWRNPLPGEPPIGVPTWHCQSAPNTPETNSP